jgi:hypothetical protein
MPEAAEGLSFDLADTLPSDPHLPADFLKGVGLAINQSVP